MIKKQLRKQANLTTNMSAKLGKDENVSTEVLCKICKALDCGLDDIIEIIIDGEVRIMKFYIGLGGIGCKTLVHYQNMHKQDPDKKFYYVNTDTLSGQTKGDVYIFSNAEYGTRMRRYIGRNIVNYEIYNGLMSDFFKDIKTEADVELFFSLSSFGGFGGAAIIPLIDYLEAIAWKKLHSCVVFSFNENAYKRWGFPEEIIHRFQENTMEYVNELIARELEISSAYCIGNKFNPGCRAYLIDTKDISVDEFWKCFDYSEQELKKIDCKENYRLKQARAYNCRPDVFISYSSKDQEIADKIVDSLMRAGIQAWIATKDIKEGSYAKQIMQAIRDAKLFLVVISKNSISSEQVKNEIDRAFNRVKDGMIIVPFIIDNAEMDDECQYYLCRQEIFYGKKPPIDDRIHELITRIKDVLD